MAKAQMLMPEEFLRDLSKLEKNTDDITKKVLKAGADAVLPVFKSNLAASIGKNLKVKSRSTGQLQRAVGVSKPLMDNNGNYNIKIGFSEPRSDGESNAKLANILEYGRHGQPAKPFLKPTKSKTKKHAETAMKNKFEEEVNKI